jgi:hypothetical protein
MAVPLQEESASVAHAPLDFEPTRGYIEVTPPRGCSPLSIEGVTIRQRLKVKPKRAVRSTVISTERAESLPPPMTR